MGIPLYFRCLTQKYPNIIYDLEKATSEERCHILYFDLNGLIHPSCTRARAASPVNATAEDLEDAMFREIRKQIEYIVTKVNPSTRIVLSVDGVAPMAKLSQQRTRRYKSHILRTMTNRIRTKHGEQPDVWDTNAISPGTDFMNHLMNWLETYVVERNRESESTPSLSGSSPSPLFELSSCHVPGEGEHKIFQEIRESPSVSGEDEPVRYIYGLDADLIMLSLASHRHRIRLLRESVHFGKVKQDSLLLLEVDDLRKALCSEIRSHIPELTDEEEMVRDYLCLCFMLGNDFLPHLPSLHIGEGSMDVLLEWYAKARQTHPHALVQREGAHYSIHLPLLRLCVEGIAQEENEMVRSFHVSYRKRRYREMHNLCPMEREIRRIEHLPLTKPTKNTIHFDKEGWSDRYYQRHLGISSVDPRDIRNMCQQYYSGLVWTLRYYLEGVPSWDWTYSFRIAPTAHDLYQYFLCPEAARRIDFPETYPAPPHIQLLCILPPSSVSLLPKPYRCLMTDIDSPIRDMYPNAFLLEMIYTRFFHEAMPLLPMVDRVRIAEAVSS